MRHLPAAPDCGTNCLPKWEMPRRSLNLRAWSGNIGLAYPLIGLGTQTVDDCTVWCFLNLPPAVAYWLTHGLPPPPPLPSSLSACSPSPTFPASTRTLTHWTPQTIPPPRAPIHWFLKPISKTLTYLNLGLTRPLAATRLTRNDSCYFLVLLLPCWSTLHQLLVDISHLLFSAYYCSLV